MDDDDDDVLGMCSEVRSGSDLSTSGGCAGDGSGMSVLNPVEDGTTRAVAGSGLRFFFGWGSDPSVGRFLQDRWRVPGRLSGPLRLGAAS